MGNALVFKSIIDEIEEDEKNQYYTDIAYQVGRLIRQVMFFDPISSSDLVANFGMNDTNIDNIDELTGGLKYFFLKNLNDMALFVEQLFSLMNKA